jgi:hypothetical protein
MTVDLVSFLPVPQMIGVSLSIDEDPEAPAIPTIATRYDSDEIGTGMSLESFQVITGVFVTIGPSDCGDPDRSDVTMTAIHDCSAPGCPTFTGKLRFTLSNEALEPFRMQFETLRSFLWVCSTPTYEGRIVVSKPTSRVVTCTISERTLQ